MFMALALLCSIFAPRKTFKSRKLRVLSLWLCFQIVVGDIFVVSGDFSSMFLVIYFFGIRYFGLFILMIYFSFSKILLLFYARFVCCFARVSAFFRVFPCGF